MKKRLLLISILLICICIFTFHASADTVSLENQKISMDIPNNYTLIQNTDTSVSKNSDFIGTLGHSVSSFKAYMKDANILAFAATADNTKQMQLKSWTTDFSEQIGNLALFSDDEDAIAKASESLSAVGSGETLKGLSRILRSDGTLYIKIQKLVSGEKEFSYLQYVTIVDGRYYTLVYYNFGGEFTDEQLAEASSIFSSLSIEQKSNITLKNSNNILNIALLWIAIAVISIFAVILLFSLIRDLFRRRREKNESLDKIERRKF